MNEKQALKRQLHLKTQAISLLKDEIRRLKDKISHLASPEREIQLTLPFRFKIK